MPTVCAILQWFTFEIGEWIENCADRPDVNRAVVQDSFRGQATRLTAAILAHRTATLRMRKYILSYQSSAAGNKHFAAANRAISQLRIGGKPRSDLDLLTLWTNDEKAAERVAPRPRPTWLSSSRRSCDCMRFAHFVGPNME